MADSSNQLMDTMENPSLAKTLWFFGRTEKVISAPTMAATAMVCT